MSDARSATMSSRKKRILAIISSIAVFAIAIPSFAFFLERERVFDNFLRAEGRFDFTVEQPVGGGTPRHNGNPIPEGDERIVD